MSCSMLIQAFGRLAFLASDPGKEVPLSHESRASRVRFPFDSFVSPPFPPSFKIKSFKGFYFYGGPLTCRPSWDTGLPREFQSDSVDPIWHAGSEAQRLGISTRRIKIVAGARKLGHGSFASWRRKGKKDERFCWLRHILPLSLASLACPHFLSKICRMPQTLYLVNWLRFFPPPSLSFQDPTLSLFLVPSSSSCDV